MASCALLVVGLVAAFASSSAQLEQFPLGFGGATGDGFGSNIAVSSNGIVAVGSSGIDCLMIFSCDPSATCIHLQSLCDGLPGYELGVVIALSANASFMAVGARGNSTVYTFTTNTTVDDRNFTLVQYRRRQTIPFLGGIPTDLFGSSLSMSGDGTQLAVGAIGMNASSGGVYVYSCDPSTGMCGNRSFCGGYGTQFGWATAFSADGSLLAVISNGAVDSFGGLSTFECTPGAGCSSRFFANGAYESLALNGVVDAAPLVVVGSPRTSAFYSTNCYTWGCEAGKTTTITAPPGTLPGARFGASIAVSPAGTMVAVGAPSSGEYGATYVYSCYPFVDLPYTVAQCSAPLYAQPVSPVQNGSLFGAAVGLSNTFLVSSALALDGGSLYVGPSPPTIPLGVAQYASFVGVQMLSNTRGLPGPPWAPSPLQPSTPFLVAIAPSPNYPNLVPLYRCFCSGPGQSSVGAWGFGTSPGCDVGVAWDQSEVIGYASTVSQAPFTSPLWLCQTAGHSPNMTAYFGWVPGYGACASTSVAAIIGFVAVPLSA